MNVNDEELSPTENQLSEMSNLFSERTGLPVTVWVVALGEAHLHHAPRVKVSEGRTGRFIASFTVELPVRLVAGHLPEPQLLAVTDWIEANRETLLRYSRVEIDSAMLAEFVKRVETRDEEAAGQLHLPVLVHLPYGGAAPHFEAGSALALPELQPHLRHAKHAQPGEAAERSAPNISRAGAVPLLRQSQHCHRRDSWRTFRHLLLRRLVETAQGNGCHN